jgi:hypothetical protein
MNVRSFPKILILSVCVFSCSAAFGSGSTQADTISETGEVFMPQEKISEIRIVPRESRQLGPVTVTWLSLTIEGSVHPDGSSAGQAVWANLSLSDGRNLDTWVLLFPADYRGFISSQSEQVTRDFYGMKIWIANADFDSNSPWMDIRILWSSSGNP